MSKTFYVEMPLGADVRTSEKIQQALFDMGYRWPRCGHKRADAPRATTSKYLLVNDGVIYNSCAVRPENIPQAKVTRVTSYLITVPEETIEIEGRRYKRTEALAALNVLTSESVPSYEDEGHGW